MGRRTVVLAVGLLLVVAGGAAVVHSRGGASSSRTPTAASTRANSSVAGAPEPAQVAADAPADDAGPAAWAAAVAAENARPGDLSWSIGPSAGEAGGLDVYADRVSVLPGQTVGLYVSGRGPIIVRAERIGWYDGAGARAVWQGAGVATPQPGPRVLTAALADAGGATGTRAVIAPWHPTMVITTTGWPEGHYLLRVDATGVSRYTLLTVRSASTRGRVVVMAAPMTWQAYNTWGGRSLYGDLHSVFANRSYAVSFDRPYNDGDGSGRFLTYDAPVITLAERLGLPLAWVTDYDLARDPHLLDGATALIIAGHAEYWTGPMRDEVTAATRRGMNLAVLGANTAYWRVRLAGAQVGLAAAPQRRDGAPRVIFGPKQASADPLAASDPGGATARFRDAPGARLDETLTGMRYECYPAETDWVVADPTWWGYAGTGVRLGQRLPGVVGPEADRVYPVATRPRPEDVVAYNRYLCGRNRPTAHTGVYWVTAGGGGVFAVGTMRWPEAMAEESGAVPASAAVILEQVTTTVLRAFASPKAGLTHPAHDNVADFWLPTSGTGSAD